MIDINIIIHMYLPFSTVVCLLKQLYLRKQGLCGFMTICPLWWTIGKQIIWRYVQCLCQTTQCIHCWVLLSIFNIIDL
nr:MAG TPA: hypothetical protein [Caudoviricetes sp.]